MISDHKDLYIRGSSHPSYEEDRIIEDELVNVVVQKLEMIIFSNKGDLYGDQYFGSDLEYYLWSTKVPTSEIKKVMTDQINRYIPELNILGYDLNIDIYEGEIRDIMYLRWKIKGYNINFILD